MRRTAAVIATASLALATVASTAQAASPPNGKYPCYQFISGTGLVGAGILRIHSASRYSVNGGRKATYKASGRKLSFPSGPYRGSFRGKWSRKNGDVVIHLYRKGDTKYQRALLTCS